MTERITIETFVPVPAADAWRAYTTPDAITRWNFASPDWCCPSASVELWAGGRHCARMEARDGSFGFDLEGTYESVDPHKGLVLILADGRRVETTFVAETDGTRVRTVFEAESTNPVDMQRTGWQAILDNYAAFVRNGATARGTHKFDRLDVRNTSPEVGTMDMEFKSKVRTCLWFEKGGREAAEFYVSLIPNSSIDSVLDHHSPSDPMVIEFTLAGCPMMILTAGPHYKLTPAVSISVLTKNQSETDALWDALLANGGEESRCGWLTDRFGVSWQIVPEVLPRLINQPDKAAGKRAQQAMMQMRKIDIAALEAAARGGG